MGAQQRQHWPEGVWRLVLRKLSRDTFFGLVRHVLRTQMEDRPGIRIWKDGRPQVSSLSRCWLRGGRRWMGCYPLFRLVPAVRLKQPRYPASGGWSRVMQVVPDLGPGPQLHRCEVRAADRRAAGAVVDQVRRCDVAAATRKRPSVEALVGVAGRRAAMQSTLES